MSETIQTIEMNEEEAPRVVVFEEALEAVLFAAGHPITYSTLARVFQLTPAVVKDKVFDYAMKYNDPTIPRGVILLTYKDSCQLCTNRKSACLSTIQEVCPSVSCSFSFLHFASLSKLTFENFSMISCDSSNRFGYQLFSIHA